MVLPGAVVSSQDSLGKGFISVFLCMLAEFSSSMSCPTEDLGFLLAVSCRDCLHSRDKDYMKV